MLKIFNYNIYPKDFSFIWIDLTLLKYDIVKKKELFQIKVIFYAEILVAIFLLYIYGWFLWYSVGCYFMSLGGLDMFYDIKMFYFSSVYGVLFFIVLGLCKFNIDIQYKIKYKQCSIESGSLVTAIDFKVLMSYFRFQLTILFLIFIYISYTYYNFLITENFYIDLYLSVNKE